MREWASKRCSITCTIWTLVAGFGPATAVGEETDTTAATASLHALVAAPRYPVDWHDLQGYPSMPNIENDTAQSIAPISFRDGSRLGRLKSIRQLSLLTITETRKSRVYIGVNDEGVFGIHLNFLARKQDDRFAEILRMPYLLQRSNDR